jgi:hypothetical protein
VNPNDVAPMVIGLVFFIVAGAVLIFRGPIGKAIARRLDGGQAAPEGLEGRVTELEMRLAEAEVERHELAERVDFAERLLAQVRERKELPR